MALQGTGGGGGDAGGRRGVGRRGGVTGGATPHQPGKGGGPWAVGGHVRQQPPPPLPGRKWSRPQSRRRRTHERTHATQSGGDSEDSKDLAFCI